MKFKFAMDSKGFTKKPTSEEVGLIINRMEKLPFIELTNLQLKESILNGITIRPSECRSKEKDWISQQLFFIDVDNDLTIEGAIKRCEELGILPSFIYTSFSHTESHHKYRLVFAFNKPIMDFNLALKIQLTLVNIIKESDKACTNLNRIYYGGHNIVFESDVLLDLDTFKFDYDEKTHDKKVQSFTERHEVKGAHNRSKLSYNSIMGTFYPNNKYIANNDIESLKAKLNYPHKTFNNKQEFLDFICSINLADLLEIQKPSSFNCLFHKDNSPSASIFLSKSDGHYLYKCHSSNCGVSYNIVNIIERIGNFKTRHKTYEFIKSIFNLEIAETIFQIEHKEILIDNLKTLFQGEFDGLCTQANKNIGRIKIYLEQIILIALDNIYDERYCDNDGNIVFFASAKYIAKKLSMNPNNAKIISQRLAVLAYHNLIVKVDDSNVPEILLKKANHLSASNGTNNKHVNFFSIPSYTTCYLQTVEEQARKWKDNSYTMKAVSREMFYRTEGLDVANWLYPQFKEVTIKINGESKVTNRGTSKVSDEITNDITDTIFHLIKEHGYTSERQVIKLLEESYSRKITELQIKRCLPDILQSYDLIRKKATKQLKIQFNIESKGFPYVITKKVSN